MKVFFSLCVLWSAALLMIVQPMAARWLLPHLGGSPSVWNACMVFFQAGLLAGYAYAWLGPKIFGVRQQAMIHIALLGVALLTLSIPLPAPESPPAHPVLWTLQSLTLGVALPYFALAATSSLGQLWYAKITGQDPYFLYAASNLGSFLGLFAYPFAIEPNLGGTGQSGFWRIGFAIQIILMAGAVAFLLRFLRTDEKSIDDNPHPAPVAPSQVVRWVLLAFAPSSLLLSVTHFLTTDLAPAPILWVFPLALYLLSFVVVFARRPWVSRTIILRYVPAVILILIVIWLSEAVRPLLVIVGVLLGGFFWLALFCHGELAASRPPAARLGEFYFWIALGGVLGGSFNVFIAPAVITSLLEIPLILVLIGAMQPWPKTTPLEAYLRAAVLGALALFFVLIGHVTDVPAGPRFLAILFFPLVATLLLKQPGPYAAALALVVAAGLLAPSVHGDIIERRRSFFGIHTVARDGDFIKLLHGNTLHGLQSLNDLDDPKAYYHRKSPIAEVIKKMRDLGPLTNVGVIGLGSGALAAYALPGETWTFFEIDPDVPVLAQTYFAYLGRSQGTVKIVLGDARLTLSQANQKFDLLIVDAFGSDSIPAHLLTREALAIYKEHLSPGGVIAFHVSNNYLDLLPVLGQLGWPTRFSVSEAWSLPELDLAEGRMSSNWVVMSSDGGELARFTPAPRWDAWRLTDAPPWTDDYINLLSAVKWDELIARE